MTLYDCYKTFEAILGDVRSAFICDDFFTFSQPIGWKRLKYDYEETFEVILGPVRPGFMFDDFPLLVNLLAEILWTI